MSICRVIERVLCPRPSMSAPQSDVVTIEEIPVDDESDKGIIALVTINRPNKLNALNADVMAAIKAMSKWADETAAVRCVVITGAQPLPAPEGKRPKPNAFVAGADITEFVGKGSEDIRPIFADNGWEAIWKLSKPTIAMVDGFALGGGCEVACSCDIRIASTRSKFGTPEINLGLIPGGGGTQRLVNLVGYGKTMEMVMTGDMVSASEAKEIGLVNHVCEPEELKEFTMKMARTIGSKSSHTLGVAKATIRSALDTGITEGIAVEADAFANLFDTEDKEIGVNAFLNRETANWAHK